eukprot:ANDGO_05060.mRNA.1 hypothetical protein
MVPQIQNRLSSSVPAVVGSPAAASSAVSKKVAASAAAINHINVDNHGNVRPLLFGSDYSTQRGLCRTDSSTVDQRTLYGSVNRRSNGGSDDRDGDRDGDGDDGDETLRLFFGKLENLAVFPSFSR